MYEQASLGQTTGSPRKKGERGQIPFCLSLPPGPCSPEHHRKSCEREGLYFSLWLPDHLPGTQTGGWALLRTRTGLFPPIPTHLLPQDRRCPDPNSSDSYTQLRTTVPLRLPPTPTALHSQTIFPTSSILRPGLKKKKR